MTLLLKVLGYLYILKFHHNILNIIYICIVILGRRVIEISESLIWSKTLMELIFNPRGEFRWSPEGPISQIHSPHLLAGDPGIFSDLLGSVKMLKREWGAENNAKLPHLFILSKIVVMVPELAVGDLPSAELQPWFLRMLLRTCPWAEHSMMSNLYFSSNFYSFKHLFLKISFTHWNSSNNNCQILLEWYFNIRIFNNLLAKMPATVNMYLLR